MCENDKQICDPALTPKQSQIMDYLSRCTCPATPTEIGMACGKSYSAASSWASSGLASLVKRREVIRHDGGSYEIFRSW